MRNYLYFIDNGKVIIGDLESISKSENTVDVKFNDIATNEKLKLALNLYPAHNDDTRAFAFFLSCFGMSSDINDKETKLNSNPILRILCLNKESLENIKNLI